MLHLIIDSALFNQFQNQLDKSKPIACAGGKCQQTVYDEQYRYTGKIRVEWADPNWDDPRNYSFDLKDVIKSTRSVPVELFKVTAAQQFGELRHEVRVDRQYYELTTINSIEAGRRHLGHEVGNTYKWVSDPAGPVTRQRINFQTCISVMCATVR